MRTLQVRWVHLAILLFLLLCWKQESVIFAQELTLSGAGPINHSLAGVAAALPRDSAGAIQWNPATISFLEKSEFQFGWGRHNPPWYGDEPIGYTALVGLWLTWEIVKNTVINNNNDDDWKQWNSNSDDTYPKFGSYKHGKIRVPALSYVYHKDRYWSYGLAISEYGANKAGALVIDDKVGICEYSFRGYEFVPTVSYKESKRFSFGLSPIFSIEEMPNASLPVIVSRYSAAPEQDRRSKAGFGLQAGMFYSPVEHLRFGASVRTPLLINRFTYRWTDPITGELGTQQLYFSQDSAFRIVLGTSYTFNSYKTTLAADFRYSDYSHASALYDIPASFDTEVKKQDISRAVYSLAFGAEHRPWDIIAFRMGYQWNHAVIPKKAIIYNTGLPIQSGHSIHYGVTFFFSEIFDLSFSSSNSFGSGQETIHTESGSVSFRRNPNRSNFWAAARVRF